MAKVMALDENVRKYLDTEKQSLVELISLLSIRLADVEAQLSEQGDETLFGEVTERRSDPFEILHIWPLTATSTMGACREALGRFGQEATSAETASLMRRGSSVIPVKTITQMLYQRGSKERSGIYRVHRKPGRAKYGLIAWKSAGAARASDGGYQAPDEEIPEMSWV